MSKTIFSLFKRLAKVILVCVIIIGGFLFAPNTSNTTETLKVKGAKAADMPSVIITEVVPNGSPDWAELYCVSGPIDISGYILTDMDGTDTSLAASSVTLQTGDYAVVYWQEGTDETDATGDTNSNGYFDLYVSDTSLTASDDQLVLDDDEDVSNGAIDAVVWTNNDGGMTPSEVTDGNNLVSYGQWTGTFAVDDQSAAVILGKSSQSIGRISLAADTNSKDDWQIFTAQTPGEANKENSPPTIENTSANPSSIPADGRSTTLLSAKVSDPDGLEDIDSVIVDLSPLGGSETQAMYDDATNGDTTASDGTFSYSTFVSVATKAGSYSLSITVIDSIGNEASKTLTLAVTQPVYSDKIIINESLPNPEGTDSEGEWIELYNQGSATVDLFGWQLDDIDGGSSPYTLPDETSIGAGQYSVFYRTDTGIALNNDGDQVRLLQPDENVTSSANYADYAEEGLAYALTSEGEWAWTTTPTPGEQNLITSPGDEEEEKEGEEKGEAGESGDHPKELSISDVREEEKGVWVKTKGIITCPPGIFSGSTIFYIQDEKAGIRIYSSSEDVGELKLGDEAEVIGKVSERSGEKKINIKGEEDVTVASHKDPLEAKHVKTGEIGEDYEGLLVIISGKIVETHGSVFYVDDGSGKIKIYIKKSTGIDKPEMHKEDVVTITGIVSEAYDAYRILPRFQDDVKLGKVLGAASEDKLAKTGTSFWLVIVITCLIMGLGCLSRFIVRLKKIA